MIRFLAVPKSYQAEILFGEFTDNDALLEGLRVALQNSRIMIQMHRNRWTAGFLSFFENGNIAIWPRKILDPEETVQLHQFLVDMLRTFQFPLFRTIVGENEELTLQALIASGWQQDGVWRHVGRQQTGEFFDGIILTFDGRPIDKEDDHELRSGHVQDTQAEEYGNTDADTTGSSPVLDPRPVHVDEHAEPTEPDADVRGLPQWDVSQSASDPPPY